jgi:hypothetical protein
MIRSNASSPKAQLQLRYEKHRMARNEQQRTKILAEDFHGWTLDKILMRLDGPTKEEGFLDPRNCLVIWARPPPNIKELISFVQKELKDVAPCKFCTKSLQDQSTHTI